MTPERWQQLEELFHAALNLEPGRRAEFVNRACAGDESMRKDVESLLANHDPRWSLVDEPMVHRPLGLAEGEAVGPYKIIGFLGKGGYGEVYLAEESRPPRKVALKLLPAHSSENEALLRRFEQEAQAASTPNHPNICTVYGVGETPDGLRYIAMEYVDGMTLRRYMPIGGLEVGKALQVAVQVATAIAAAHSAGVVHRDIKPENIMIRRADGIVKVLDFGIAKLVEQRAQADPELQYEARQPSGGSAATSPVRTKTGVPLGTPFYMSPEQLQGLPVDARTDIWSFGVMLYEMLMGHVPFEGENEGEIRDSIMTKEPFLPPHHSAAFPVELQRIVTKALRKDKVERYLTIDGMLDDLRNLKHDSEDDEEYLKLFIGEKHTYYLAKWSRMEHSGRRISFNWAAFLAGPAWMLYRKMYLYAIPLSLMLCLIDIADLVRKPSAADYSNFFSSIVIYDVFYNVLLNLLGDSRRTTTCLLSSSKFLALLIGCFGNTIYRSHVNRKLRRIAAKGLPREQERSLIRRKGGTSVGATVGLLTLFTFATLLIARWIYESF